MRCEKLRVVAKASGRTSEAMHPGMYQRNQARAVAADRSGSVVFARARIVAYVAW